LILTNKRLLFIREVPEGTFVKEVECSLSQMIDVSIQGNRFSRFGKHLVVGSGVGNIRLRLDGVDADSFEDFKATLESASGKSLAPVK